MALPKNITLFRGVAGEVVAGFLRPRIFLTLIPVWLYWGAFGIAAAFLSRAVNVIAMQCVLLVGLAMLVGRFAIPASRGDLDAGFFDFNNNIDSGELIGFGFRYMLAVMFWLVPTGILVVLVLKGQSIDSFAEPSLASGGALVFVLLSASAVSYLAASTSVIIATGTSSMGETLQLKHWSYVLVDRRADFITFLSAAFGGLATFCAIYAIPYLAVTYLLTMTSTYLGGIFATAAILVPFTVSPVLIGRLAGAFILGEETITGMETKNAVAKILGSGPKTIGGYGKEVSASGNMILPNSSTEAPGSRSDIETIQQHKTSIDAADFVRKLQRLKPEEVSRALEKAANEHAQNNRDLKAAYEYMLLLRKTGDEETALRIAAKSINQALRELDWSNAALFYLCLQQSRFQLQLEKEQFQMLANHFQAQNKYQDAAWCTMRSGEKEGRAGIELQKVLIEIAEAASAAMKNNEAAQIYQQILEGFPASNFTDYVQKQLALTKSDGKNL